ncbi:MAG: hypothetical protein ACOX4G_03180 [Limnochordia bacterium]
MNSQSKRTRATNLLYPAFVITPSRLAYLMCSWLLAPLTRATVTRWQIPLWRAALCLYGSYLTLAAVWLLWWLWPRQDPIAEGLRRARRLLAVDPGMALVRGRGALEHALREAVEKLSLARTPNEPPGMQELLLVLRPHMPSDLFHQADRLRRLGNMAAHDPDWSISRREAKAALVAAARTARWSRRMMPGK